MIIVAPLEPRRAEEAAQLFGECIAEHWPVAASEAAGWVRAEFKNPKTVIIGALKKPQSTLIGCAAVTPLEEIWRELQNEERCLITAGLCALPETAGVEIPGGLVHFGGLAVRKAYRVGGTVSEPLFAATIEATRSMGRGFMVAQTARPNAQYPELRGLHRCVSTFGFRELVPADPLPPTVGGLEKVWMWRKV